MTLGSHPRSVQIRGRTWRQRGTVTRSPVGRGTTANPALQEELSLAQVDIARWALGVKFPTKASAIGGKFMFDDDQETPNTLNCAFEFNESGKKKMLEFEVRHWMSNGEATVHEKGNNAIGNLFYGSKGYLAWVG